MNFMLANTGQKSQLLTKLDVLHPAGASAPTHAPLSKPQSALKPAKSGSFAARASRPVFTIVCILAIAYGWRLSAREEFIPDEGWGYWIGIMGAVALIVQLAYPLRKRAKFMRRMGPAPMWFRAHMALGVIGPILILYHSNFSLGATNSNIALFAMLTVAGSEIIGRYIFGKIHNGLYGAHSNLQDLLSEATRLLTVVESDVGGAGGSVAAKLTDFGTKILQPRRSLIAKLGLALWLGITVPIIRLRILSLARQAIRRNAARLNWNTKDRNLHYKIAKQHIGNYLDAVVKASELSFYERLFALWHILHMPMYFLLIFAGIVHIVAVHLY